MSTTRLRWAVEVRHPQFFDGGRAHIGLDRLLTDVGAERVVLDTRPLFSKPPTDDAERDGWSTKPRVPVAPTALTSTPIVRLIGRTNIAETVAGWQPWLAVLAAWVSEGRTPIVFVHTPDNVEALALARQLHADLGAFGCDVEDLPMVPAESLRQGSLFD